MKRVDLVRQIGRAAKARGMEWRQLRRGDDEVWSLGGERVIIPGHRELNEALARSIRRDLQAVFGKEWWAP